MMVEKILMRIFLSAVLFFALTIIFFPGMYERDDLYIPGDFMIDHDGDFHIEPPKGPYILDGSEWSIKELPGCWSDEEGGECWNEQDSETPNYDHPIIEMPGVVDI